MKRGDSLKAVEWVRRIRDRMGRRWARLDLAETLEFFRQAGVRARRRARRPTAPPRPRRRAG